MDVDESEFTHPLEEFKPLRIEFDEDNPKYIPVEKISFQEGSSLQELMYKDILNQEEWRKDTFIKLLKDYHLNVVFERKGSCENRSLKQNTPGSKIHEERWFYPQILKDLLKDANFIAF